jgi:anaerobic ribonucleoside-triphosphate reductase activating protein
MTTAEVIEKMLSNPLTDGLTLSGGEPFLQPEDCLTIARAAHEQGLSVWCYTGYTLEHLMQNGTEEQKALLREVDVLVDGRYIQEKRSLALEWRGSSNQRVINLKEVQGDG